MKPTHIVYAHPATVALMAKNTTVLPNGDVVPRRFSGSRRSIRERVQAAWLVFSGQADALVWLEDRRT